MSSLRCPNCSGAFNEILREGILIDVCQQCKGVWLDRGELEKLLSMARSGDLYGESSASQRSAPPPQNPPQYHRPQDYHPTTPPPQYQRPDRDRDYYDHDNYKKHYKKRKSRFEDIFDIFD